MASYLMSSVSSFTSQRREQIQLASEITSTTSVISGLFYTYNRHLRDQY